jgi:hypothetical protein
MGRHAEVRFRTEWQPVVSLSKPRLQPSARTFGSSVLDLPIVKNGKGSASELAAQWLVLNQDKILAHLPESLTIS